MPTPLLRTKLFVPRPQAGAVERPRVAELLRRGTTGKLTLVSAQAGFGKTTAMAAWAHEDAAPGSVAWVSLDADDAEAETFWAYAVTALADRVPEVREGVLPLLGRPGPPLTVVLAELVNRLADAPGDVVLVLDDYHLAEGAGVAEGMLFLLDHLPPQVHVVLGTRADPGLPLSRLRARGEVVEVRAADLRFTLSEAAGFLEQAGLELDAEDVAVLEQRTEGWAAALQLAALSLRGRSDTSQFLAHFAGDDRFIVDYLADEVLARQPSHVREFLLRTSVLDRLSGPLCDAVTGQVGGDATLRELERQNLFVVALDSRRQWFRYHHLFADVLRAHLAAAAQGPPPAELHARASAWFEEEGQPVSAVDHALAAGDVVRAAALMERSIPDLLRRRQEAVVAGWIGALPADVVHHRPALAMGFVAALMERNEFASVAVRLDDIDRTITRVDTASPGGGGTPGILVEDPLDLPRLAGRVELYRAALSVVGGDLEETRRHAELAARLAAPDDHPTRAGAWGLSGLAYWRQGDLDGLHRCYSLCVDDLVQAGHVSDVLGCSTTLADVRVAQGRLGEAEATLRKALDLAATADGVVRGTADLHSALGAVALERGDVTEAESQLRRAQQLGDEAGMPQHAYQLRVNMALVRQAHGDLDEALSLLDEAARVYVADFKPDVRPVHATRARALVAAGRLDEARRWAAEHGLDADDAVTYADEYEHVTLAMLLVAELEARPAAPTDVAAVRGLLQRLHDGAQLGGRAGTVLEVDVLQALAALASGDRSAAAGHLRHALNLARPEGLVRVFTQHGVALTRLVRLLPAEQQQVPFVRALATAGAAPQVAAGANPAAGRGLVDPLSSRELEVLRLLATDLTGPELARQLVVSLNTLRTHTRNVYANLGVSGRRAAVTRARELDLLGGRDR
ncbi:LuxR C-terminal-related transcriptional regulator [Terrabacter sp. 2RAF25]|uniref:LuxR C-terminal-related transcriptional regulator n=1 Tax=Terrabacter sp. 2RAF25 TaxID=3232998 RepID=UPI003F95A52E